uniref:Uncharacterized protein n=1 Tax=Acrobeloides nanus TaxID=290746 RepID=A0A914CZB2_9BILA
GPSTSTPGSSTNIMSSESSMSSIQVKKRLRPRSQKSNP